MELFDDGLCSSERFEKDILPWAARNGSSRLYDIAECLDLLVESLQLGLSLQKWSPIPTCKALTSVGALYNSFKRPTPSATACDKVRTLAMTPSTSAIAGHAAWYQLLHVQIQTKDEHHGSVAEIIYSEHPSGYRMGRSMIRL